MMERGVVNSGEKWGKVAKIGERCRKLGKSGEN